MFPTWKENKPVSMLVSVLLAVLSVLVGVKIWNGVATHAEIGHEPRGRDVITIEGDGKITSKPTLALLTVGLVSNGKDIPSVQADNATKVNAITSAVKSLGVADADVQTSNYQIQPRYEYPQDGSRRLVGYEITQTLGLKIRDLNKVGDVIAKATELGSNDVSGLQFTIDDPKELQQQARVKALADAQKKAKELTETLGVSLGKVVTFSENSGGYPPPMPMYAMNKAAFEAAPVAPDIQSGSLDVSSHVSVTFEVR
jgi:uncharacterized protein YggE